MATLYVEFKREEWPNLTDSEFEAKKTELLGKWRRDESRENTRALALNMLIGFMCGLSFASGLFTILQKNRSKANENANKPSKAFYQQSVHVIDPVGRDFYPFGLAGHNEPVFVGHNPDEAFVVKNENPGVGIVGQIVENMLLPENIQIQKDTERAGNPVNE